MTAWPLPHAVFFDLDGTLADTVGDLVTPINALRAERGLPAMPCHEFRRYVSLGTSGLLRHGLGLSPSDPAYTAIHAEFLRRYATQLDAQTTLFAGMAQVLEHLEQVGVPWGVVSNKHERFVRPILQGLGLQHRCVAIVGGDTTEHAKPHPAPLLYAAQRAGVTHSACVYVGDDQRDIQAGQAAGMRTIAVTYGYAPPDPDPSDWGANALIAHPQELIPLLGLNQRSIPNSPAPIQP